MPGFLSCLGRGGPAGAFFDLLREELCTEHSKFFILCNELASKLLQSCCSGVSANYNVQLF